MENAAEKEKTSPEDQVPEDVWFQITFTLDPKSFRRLWAYAESVNSSVSSVARERVLNFLKVLESPSHHQRSSPKTGIRSQL